MRYVYLTNTGSITSTVETGGDTIPEGAIAWPEYIPFMEAIYYGYDSTRNEWVRPDESLRPSVFHTFDFATREWIDRRTLQEVKNVKWEEIKSNRDTQRYLPLETPYGIFDATFEAQKSITDSILMLQTLAQMGTPSTIDFTLANNTTITLTTDQMVQVGLLLGTRTQQLYAIGRALRAQIDSATTKIEVESITWPT